MRYAVIFLCTLFATLVSSAQVLDGQTLVAAALSDSLVYEVNPTGSMEPFVNETTWIVVRKLPFSSVREKDIILYKAFWYPRVVHAVIRRSSDGGALVVKGYANAIPDPQLVTEPMYLGTVVGVIRRPDVDRPVRPVPEGAVPDSP